MEMKVMLEAAVASDIEGNLYNIATPVPTFAARRSYRPQVMIAGLAFMLACGVAAAALALAHDAAAVAPYVAGAGVLAYLVATMVAMIPQSVTLAVDGRTVTPSWRPAIRVSEQQLSSWVVAGIDAAMGLALTIKGDRGSLRIGGTGHDGEGYELRGKPVRTIDCHLDKGELDALLAVLGIVRGDAGPLAVPLVRSSQSFGGMLRTMLPWILAIGVLGVVGVVVGNTEAGERFSSSPEGQLTMAVASGAIGVIGIAAMVIRGRRVKLPELELRFDDDALIVVTTRTAVETRIPWGAITIEKLRYSVTSRVGTFTMPVLVLGIGRKPLRIGAWDTTLAWPGESATTWRGPTWLVGAARWPRFLDALRRHGRG
jgi:hypothetical protein